MDYTRFRAGLSAVVLTASLVAISATAASAGESGSSGITHATCSGTKIEDKDSTPNELHHSIENPPIRNGSSTSCTELGRAPSQDNLDYHCFTQGSDDQNWTYLRNARTNVQGWVRSDRLQDRGSRVYCGF